MAARKKAKGVGIKDIIKVNNGSKVQAIYETDVLKFQHFSGGACLVDAGGASPEDLGYCTSKAFPDVINDFIKKFKRRKKA